MQGKKLLFLAILGLFSALYSYISLPFSFSRSPGAESVPWASYRQVVLDPPPLKVKGEVMVPAGQILGAGNTYLPLSRALSLLGWPSSGRALNDLNEVRLPVWGNGSSGYSHYRYYPVYNILACVEPQERAIHGRLFLAYQNPYFYPLSELQFNLPANGLPGAGNLLTIHQVLLNSKEAKFKVQGTRLQVPLSQPLLSKQTAAVEILFSTRLPPKPARLGVFDGVIMASGWYPLLAPRQKGSWQGMAEGATFGDPYFADAAYYKVDLDSPSKLAVVASGRVTGRQEKLGRTVWSFTSEHPIREFAFAAAEDWQFSSRTVGRVELLLAARGQTPSYTLETAEKALSYFQEYFGSYPFSYLNLVEVPLEGLVGMEYPGLIFLSTLKSYSPPVVVHEVAHQWWYNLVGSDSIRAAWIDEGLAEYSTMLYYGATDLHFYRQRKATLIAEAGEGLLPLEKDLTSYPSEEDYRRIVYRQGVLFWLKLEEKMGQATLREALRYVQEYYRFDRIEALTLKQILDFYSDPEKYLAY